MNPMEILNCTQFDFIQGPVWKCLPFIYLLQHSDPAKQPFDRQTDWPIDIDTCIAAFTARKKICLKRIILKLLASFSDAFLANQSANLFQAFFTFVIVVICCKL